MCKKRRGAFREMSRKLPVFACACAAGDPSDNACALTRSVKDQRACLTGEGLKMYPDMYFKKYMHRQKNAV